MKWPQKMSPDMRVHDNTKFCAFHNDYGHLAEESRQLKWEIEVSDQERPPEKVHKQGGAVKRAIGLMRKA